MATIVRRHFWVILLLASAFGAAGGFISATVMVDSAHAQATINRDPRVLIKEAGKPLGQKEEPRDPRLIIFSVVRLLLTVIGTALMLMFLYAGYMWWSAGGSEDKVTKAKATLRNAVIGMIIVGLSYSLVTFVFRSFFQPVSVQRDAGEVGQQIFEKEAREAAQQ